MLTFTLLNDCISKRPVITVLTVEASCVRLTFETFSSPQTPV